jgi:uncharacterized protein involved in response to NO
MMQDKRQGTGFVSRGWPLLSSGFRPFFLLGSI